jgi:hypothetical protein
MPTGYTCIIEDGDPSFQEYVWRCARAFGIMDRDVHMDAKVALRSEPNPYHLNATLAAQEACSALDAMSDDDYTARETERVAARNAEFAEFAERNRAMLDRYAKMRAAAKAWTPPTAAHAALRDFMISQIDDSTKWMDVTLPAVTFVSRSEARARLVSEIDYYAKEYGKEVDRTNERNAWVSALVGSIGTPPQNDMAKP